MKQLANYPVNPLTGLKNRYFAESHLHIRLLQVQNGTASPFPVLFLVIDRFTPLIGRYGYVAGDTVLQGVGSLLCHKLRRKDIVIHWGCDQFMVILNKQRKGSHIYDDANRLSFLIKDNPIAVQGQLLMVTVSIGATLSRPEDYVDTLIYRVQQLTHVSKLKGGGDVGIG